MKYPVPASYIGKSVIARETKDRVMILDGSKEIASHPKKVEGAPQAPIPFSAPLPRRQSRGQCAEESKLKALGEETQSYLEALKSERGVRYVWSVKKLYQMLCQYKAEDLKEALALAAQHRLFDVRRIETILLQNIAQRDYFLPLSFEPQDYEHLPQFQEGQASPEPDLKSYLPEPSSPEETGENSDDRENP